MSQALAADLPGSLDVVHLHVREAFKQRDLAVYARYLADDLTFIDPNGRVQNRQGLLRSLQRQFARLVSFDSRFDRESLAVEAGDAVETGTQTAAIALRIFLVLEVRWRISRHGRYTWRRDPEAGWALRHVLLDRDQVRREGIGLASRAAYGKLPDQGAA
jgi:ketosteroid isomerase-like protein